MSSISIIVFLLLGALVLVGAIFLQIFLSKKESKWYGLILPAITCILALFSGPIMLFSTGDILQDIITFVVVFILANIPTYILLAIYFACRSSINKKQDIDKMKIHDLE